MKLDHRFNLKPCLRHREFPEMFIIPGVGSSEDLPVEGDLGRGAVNEWL